AVVAAVGLEVPLAPEGVTRRILRKTEPGLVVRAESQSLERPLDLGRQRRVEDDATLLQQRQRQGDDRRSRLEAAPGPRQPHPGRQPLDALDRVAEPYRQVPGQVGDEAAVAGGEAPVLEGFAATEVVDRGHLVERGAPDPTDR